MKNLKSIIASIIIIMLFCANNNFAQTNSEKNVPANVVSAFTLKYPKAKIKKWAINNNIYSAKAINGHQKFYADFNQDGVWVNTTYKIKWSWDLPTAIRASLKNSKYAAWRIDGIKMVETPTAGLYQVCVDNGFLQMDADHAFVFTENKVISINPTGEILGEKSIDSPLLF